MEMYIDEYVRHHGTAVGAVFPLKEEKADERSGGRRLSFDYLFNTYQQLQKVCRCSLYGLQQGRRLRKNDSI